MDINKRVTDMKQSSKNVTYSVECELSNANDNKNNKNTATILNFVMKEEKLLDHQNGISLKLFMFYKDICNLPK